jgi:hypothetical protein
MDKLPVFFPMGAVTEKKEEKMEALWKDPNWVAERKYDGFRYQVRKENGKVSILSRNPSVESVKEGKPMPVDKTENVPHLAEWFTKVLPDGVVLDGEIITHENCESHEVTRIMGCDPEKAISRQEEEGWVNYVVFDILYWKGKDLTQFKYIERRKALEKIYMEYLTPFSSVMIAPIHYVGKEAYYEAIVQGGGEGVILKNVHGKYEISLDPKKIKKPKDTWVKVKKYDTYDCVVMGFTDPTKIYSGKEKETWSYWESADGKLHYRQNESALSLIDNGFVPVTKPYFNGWCGAIRFGQYHNGELVEVGQTSGIDDTTKHMLSENPNQHIGRVIEVGAMRQNKKSFALVHPRFLHFRNDKLAEQCIAGEC